MLVTGEGGKGCWMTDPGCLSSLSAVSPHLNSAIYASRLLCEVCFCNCGSFSVQTLFLGQEMSLGTLICDGSDQCVVPVGLVKALRLDIGLSQDGTGAAGSPAVLVGLHGCKLQEPISILYYRKCSLHRRTSLWPARHAPTTGY